MNQKLARRQLDDLFKDVKAFPPQYVRRGWLYAIRTALGMTRAVAAKRMGVTPPAFQQMEQREVDLNITLASLKKAAEALDCHLVYAIVPNRPFTEMVHAAAEDAAKKMMEGVSQTMALEDQEIKQQPWQDSYNELVEELEKNPKLIWRWIE